MQNVFKPLPKDSLAILGFHNLTPTLADPTTHPRFPQRFESLCGWLSRSFDVVTVTEGIRRLEAEETGRPMVAIIFDDGYADVHDVAVPILQKQGLTATSYVIVDSVENGSLPWYEELGRIVFKATAPRLELSVGGEDFGWDVPDSIDRRVALYWELANVIKQRFDDDVEDRLAVMAEGAGVEPASTEERAQMMNLEQVKRIADAGIEVGCHSRRHPILPAVDDARLEDEIVVSKTHLEGLIGREVTSFCFPNGDNDERCLALASNAGYEAAVSMTCGANLKGSRELYRLRRIPMSESIGPLWPFHTLYRIRATLLEA